MGVLSKNYGEKFKTFWLWITFSQSSGMSALRRVPHASTIELGVGKNWSSWDILFFAMFSCFGNIYGETRPSQAISLFRKPIVKICWIQHFCPLFTISPVFQGHMSLRWNWTITSRLSNLGENKYDNVWKYIQNIFFNIKKWGKLILVDALDCIMTIV